MRTLLYWLVGFTLLIGVTVSFIWFTMKGYETHRLRDAYGGEAVNALSLDAAQAFPSAKRDIGDMSFWPRPETPCIFTTNVVQRSGNGGRVTWDNWPSGSEPMCSDFYSSKTRDYDQRTVIPNNCIPVLTFNNKGGASHSFVVLAADGADTESLTAAQVSSEGLARLEQSGRFSSYAYTSKFVQAGGLDAVSLEITERTACDGFTLFRFQTEVEDPHSLRQEMELHGYYVGMK